MRDVVRARDVDGRLQEVVRAVRHRPTVRRAENKSADFMKQRLASRHLQFAPDLMRTTRERKILRTLAERETCDARVTVRRTLIMRRMKAVDAKHACTAPRQLIERSRAHRTETDHDDVCGPRRTHGGQCVRVLNVR